MILIDLVGLVVLVLVAILFVLCGMSRRQKTANLDPAKHRMVGPLIMPVRETKLAYTIMLALAALILVAMTLGAQAQPGISRLLDAADRYCALNDKSGLLNQAEICRSKVIHALQNGQCVAYVESEVLGTLRIECK